MCALRGAPDGLAEGTLTVRGSPWFPLHLASQSARPSQLDSAEKSLVHCHRRGGGAALVTVWHTHFQARTEERDVPNSVYSGNILAIFSVDSYA